MTDYAISVCRALGIPCAIDFIPIRGDGNVGHFFEFATRDTLYVINELPQRLNAMVRVYPLKKHRYVRYYGANNTYCNISEVAFYEEDDVHTPLQGRLICTLGCAQQDASHEYTNVYDGKTWTSFDYKEPSGGEGIRFGRSKIYI